MREEGGKGKEGKEKGKGGEESLGPQSSSQIDAPDRRPLHVAIVERSAWLQ